MTPPRRLAAVDLVRGLMMALMMVDHVREFFLLHRQVADPVDLHAAGLPLFFTRAASHICAPAFVLLTGLAVALRQDRRGDGTAATARHLVRRGLMLALLEVTVVNFAWTFQFPPGIVYLQVIWAIGLSMIALAALIHLPTGALLAASLAIILGHDVLRHVPPPTGLPGALAWSVLDLRDRFPLTNSFTLRVSYPVLPYFGVIGLGYVLGRLYRGGRAPSTRRAWLLAGGAASVALFLALRLTNVYGDRGAFVPGDSALWTLASLLNTTKYPPSPQFLLMTLGPTLLLLALADRSEGRIPPVLARFGAAPMPYYILHLYALHVVSRALALAQGATGLARFDRVASIWPTAVAFLAVVGPLTLLIAGRRGSRPSPSPSPAAMGRDPA